MANGSIALPEVINGASGDALELLCRAMESKFKDAAGTATGARCGETTVDGWIFEK